MLSVNIRSGHALQKIRHEMNINHTYTVTYFLTIFFHSGTRDKMVTRELELDASDEEKELQPPTYLLLRAPGEKPEGIPVSPLNGCIFYESRHEILKLRYVNEKAHFLSQPPSWNQI